MCLLYSHNGNSLIITGQSRISADNLCPEMIFNIFVSIRSYVQILIVFPIYIRYSQCIARGVLLLQGKYGFCALITRADNSAKTEVTFGNLLFILSSDLFAKITRSYASHSC